MTVHVQLFSFLAVFCEATTGNDQVVHILEKIDSSSFFVLPFEIEQWHYILSLRNFLTPTDVLNYGSSHLRNLTAKYKFIFVRVSSLALLSSLL